MSKAATLQLVRDLTLLTPEEGTIERYYNETVQEIHIFFYELSLLAVNIDQATFTLPDNAERLLYTFYDARDLDRASLMEYRATGIQWREKKGEPLIYTQENETERTWRASPTPDIASRSFLGFFGSPFGLDFPEYNVLALYLTRLTEAPDLFDLCIAHRILQKEFSRESDHQDIVYAERCGAIYQILFAMLLRGMQ